MTTRYVIDPALGLQRYLGLWHVRIAVHVSASPCTSSPAERLDIQGVGLLGTSR